MAPVADAGASSQFSLASITPSPFSPAPTRSTGAGCRSVSVTIGTTGRRLSRPAYRAASRRFSEVVSSSPAPGGRGALTAHDGPAGAGAGAGAGGRGAAGRAGPGGAPVRNE